MYSSKLNFSLANPLKMMFDVDILVFGFKRHAGQCQIPH